MRHLILVHQKTKQDPEDYREIARRILARTDDIRVFIVDTKAKDWSEAAEAYSALRRLVERYPASEYAPDDQQRMLFLKNRLAAYENHVADYYLRRGAYVAALNRAKSALEEFNGADSNERSLRIMARAYDELGMDDLAADTRRVLALNFPE